MDIQLLVFIREEKSGLHVLGIVRSLFVLDYSRRNQMLLRLGEMPRRNILVNLRERLELKIMAKGVDTIFRYSPLKVPSIMRYHWAAKEAFSLRGEPATVKSTFIALVSKELAEENGRELFDWNRESLDRKKEAFAKPDRFFIFADYRASETDIGEIRLQDINGSDGYIIYKYGLLFAAMSKPEAMGVLFLDEMNLAPQMIKAQFYKLVNDHCVGDIPLSDDVMVVIAGNEVQHAHGATRDPVPLVTRRANYFLRPLNDEEFSQFMVTTAHHPWVIGYLAFAPQETHSLKYDLPDEVGQPCPRTWTKLSNIILSNKNMKDEDVEMVATAYVGQASARQFMSYVKTARKVDIDSVIKKPELIKEFEKELSMIYAICTGIVEKFRTDKKVIRPAIEVSIHVSRPELGAYLMRSMKAVNPSGFMKMGFDEKVLDKDLLQKFSSRYGKFLLE